MTGISTDGADTAPETHRITVDGADVPFAEIIDQARSKAREICKDAMMLAWCNRNTGEFFPDYDCGRSDKPPWRLFADARGGNLTIEVNDGAYVFIFLKL